MFACMHAAAMQLHCPVLHFSHPSQARRGNLTLEVKEKHKLDVYKVGLL